MQKLGSIKALSTAALAIGLAAVVANSGLAAPFASKGTQTISAGATLTGAGVLNITSVAIKNIAGNTTATSIGWSNVTLPTSWKVADQYIQLATQITTGPGGIQIYTDNTSSGANPKFTGKISSFTATPAGLVDSVDTTQKLPTAWRASTGTLTSVAAIDPNAKAGESFLWFFHEDKAQVANASLNSGVFTDGDPFITVYGAPGFNGTTGGVHFAQDPASFGGFHSADTTYIYTEADFTTALTSSSGRTYGTNQLILEAFTD